MKKVITICLVIVIFGVGYTRAGTWTTLDMPGATDTVPLGISGSNIVGQYWNGSDVYCHGFLYDGTNWTTLDAPGGAVRTFLNGIDGSNIVGWYQVGSYGPWHNFLYDGTNWTTLDFVPEDIDGINIVGGNILYNMTSGTKTTLDVPGEIFGISGSNIVGWYNGTSGSQGFIYDGTNWTGLNVPGAIISEAYGIDGSNVVGWYHDSGDALAPDHGFLYDGTNWTTLNMPGATGTTPQDISGSNIVGSYYDATGYHGFIYTIPEPATICLLGLGGLALLRNRRFR